jgi:hypothetical protein
VLNRTSLFICPPPHSCIRLCCYSSSLRNNEGCRVIEKRVTVEVEFATSLVSFQTTSISTRGGLFLSPIFLLWMRELRWDVCWEISTDLQFPAAHSHPKTWNLVYPSTLFLVESCNVNLQTFFTHLSRWV